MSDVSVKVTEFNGKPAVSVKPTNVPAGNLGGAGTIQVCDSKEQAAELAKTIEAKYNNPQGDTFVPSQKASV